MQNQQLMKELSYWISEAEDGADSLRHAADKLETLGEQNNMPTLVDIAEGFSATAMDINNKIVDLRHAMRDDEVIEVPFLSLDFVEQYNSILDEIRATCKG